jgi:hypothetical protein
MMIKNCLFMAAFCPVEEVLTNTARLVSLYHVLLYTISVVEGTITSVTSETHLHMR